MTNNNIPFLDLVAPHRELKDELSSAFSLALDTGAFIGGPLVEQFERNFADFCDSRHCIGVGSGTDALRFALIGAGVKEGSVVITVPNSFIATVEAIWQAGARPEFVDVDSATYNMDPRLLQAYLESECYVHPDSGELISRRSNRPVSAIVPVHLYGQTADMDPILELAEHYNLTVIEDACQAHGAEYFSAKANRWRKAGSMGKAAAFSFYPGKNLGACGEAGAVITNDPELAKRAGMLRDHGQAQKYFHEIEGYNGRLDTIQAGILGIKLNHLANWNQARRECATRYGEMFAEATNWMQLPYEPSWAKSVYHLYVVRIADRDQLQKYLAKEGIGTGIHYPVPLHLQNALEHLGYRAGAFPVAESAAREILSLPMYPQLSKPQQATVSSKVLQFVDEHLVENRAAVGASA